MRRAAEAFVSLSTVQYWVKRAGNQRLDRVDLSDQPRGPRTPANRTPTRVAERVLLLRRELKETSPLGEYGAEAIREALITSGLSPIPHVRTISRILPRHGALDGNRRVRWASRGGSVPLTSTLGCPSLLCAFLRGAASSRRLASSRVHTCGSFK